MSKMQNLCERLGKKAADLWLPGSFLLTYVMWIVEFYIDGDFKTVGDVFAGLLVAVVATVMTFFVIALGLLILSFPVLILYKILMRLFSR